MEVVYGARRDKKGDANEYLVVGGECVLGRTWYPLSQNVKYWFNGKKETVLEVMEKLGRGKGAVKKSVDLPEEDIRIAIAIGSRYPVGTLIREEGYAALVDALFEGHSIMAPFIKA